MKSHYYYAELYESNETVKEIIEKDSLLYIELENTIFYPGGGGQPCDNGIIKNNDFEGGIVDVFRQGDKIIHKVKPIAGKIKAGDEVTCILNEKRRKQLALMHTAEHIFFRCLQQNFKDPDELVLEKIALDEKESSLFVICSKLGWPIIFKAEQETNKIIKEARQVVVHQAGKEELQKFPKLRIKEERIKGESIRIIEVEDFDWSACNGLHISNTKIINNFLATKLLSSGKSKHEIRFKVDCDDELLFMAVAARQTANILETDYLNAPRRVESMKQESEQLKKQVYALSKDAAKEARKEKIGGITLYWNVFQNINKKQLMQQAGELTEGKDNTVVLFINKTEEKAEIIFMTSEEIDAPGILLDILAELEGKGGGRNNFASGFVDLAYCEKLIEKVKEKLGSL